MVGRGLPRLQVLTACAVAVFSLAGQVAAAGDPGHGVNLESYEQMEDWQFAKVGSELPAGGLNWTVGGARFQLSEGGIRRARPIANGTVPGFLFQGRGRVVIEIENPVERRQLERFMEAEIDAFESDFTQLVVRSNDLGFLEQVEFREAAAYAADATASDRQDHWLRFRRHDSDARLVAALLNPDDAYFRADFKTAEHGWVTLDFDRARREELHLAVFRKRSSVIERWLSLDVEADAEPPGAVELEHFDCTARMVKTGKDAIDAEAGHTKLSGEFALVSRYRVKRSGDRAIRLSLHPMAKVLEVRDAEGRPLSFVRDNIGARWRTLDKRLHDVDLVVLLAEPTIAGSTMVLEFDYELEVANYMPGRSWYPVGEDLEHGPLNRHTADLTIQTRDDFDIRAMGTLEKEVVDGALRTARWRVEKPAKMITFAITRKMKEQTITAADGRKVIAFGPPVGDERLDALARDVGRSIDFFQELYQEPLPGDVLYATLIQAGHGQAFDGFLHLTEESAFRSSSRGVVELFLAHEVAHQWWGHIVGWDSYRDQWLSEGLAQYAAMMFVEAELPKGEKIFREVVTAYRDELIGSMSSSMSQFTDLGRIQASRIARKRIGPIGLGFRAATAEAPNAYYLQTYRKGALVAHMLRGLLSFEPDGEEVFKRVMRGFIERYRQGAASTADLAEEVTRHAQGDWGWFFEQWIDHAEIPTYRWSAKIGSKAEAGGAFPVELTVRQEGVSDGFRMYVPVEADFGKGRTQRVLVLVDTERKTHRLLFREHPRKVTFNPDAAVLAETERSKR